MNHALAFLAHDIRNIAAAMSLDAENTMSTFTLSEARLAKRTLQRIDRMLAICESAIKSQCSDNEDDRSVRIEKVQAHRFFQTLIASLSQPNYPVHIYMDCPRDVIITTSETRLFRLVFNLLSNAVEALGNTSGARIELSARKSVDGITFLIRDNGPGLPERVLKIFGGSSFKSKVRRGHGLGLAVAKQMAAELGVKLSLDASDNNGTCFRLSLPNAPD